MNELLITNFVKEYVPGKEMKKPDEKLLEFASSIIDGGLLILRG